MCVAWIEGRKGAIVVSPREGATDGPYQPYPTPRPNGRGPHRPVLPHRRRLRSPQPRQEALRIAQAALGLGGHHPRPLAATAGRGVRAFLLARCPEVLLAPVPWGGRASPFLLAPRSAQARALLGAPATGDPLRVGGRSGDLAHRLHPARRAAPRAGRSGLGLPRGGMAEVGFLQRLRGKVAPLVCHRRSAHLLRAQPRQRGGGAPDGGAAWRGEPRGRSCPQALRGPRLPKRS